MQKICYRIFFKSLPTRHIDIIFRIQEISNKMSPICWRIIPHTFSNLFSLTSSLGGGGFLLVKFTQFSEKLNLIFSFVLDPPPKKKIYNFLLSLDPPPSFQQKITIFSSVKMV